MLMTFAKDFGVEHFDLKGQLLDEVLHLDSLLQPLSLFGLQDFHSSFELVDPSSGSWIQNILIIAEFLQTMLDFGIR